MTSAATTSALEDPEVLAAARRWFDRERSMTELVMKVQALEESGQHEEAEAVERGVAGAREALDTAARELDVTAGDQLAARVRRMKEADMVNFVAECCGFEGCKFPHLAKGWCGTHYHRIKRAVGAGKGSWDDAPFVTRAAAGEFMGVVAPKEAKAEKPARAAKKRAPTRAAHEKRTTPAVKASPPPISDDLGSLCEELKEKVAARAALDSDIRELVERLSRATGVSA